ncbi:MAG: hypothetical protein JSU86_10795 [Phycisphaerales bacterium]|nr:MAG: hypothetical protein JSU86_10795 [Phycisphaerales bacterium]
MRLTTQRTNTDEGVELMSLDCESLGRYVRVRTLEAVTMHFASMAQQGDATLRNKQADRKAVTE